MGQVTHATSGQSRQNNFDVLRLVFAAFVICSHSFALLGYSEPVVWGRTLGNLGVHGFFVISGYLIAQSWMRSRTLAEYAGSRVLRIAPGLIVALIFASVAASVLHEYAANPVPFIIDGPVWTLTWEVICYALVAVLGIIGVLNSAAFPAFFAAAWVVYLTNISDVSDFALAIVPMLLMFGAGVLLAVQPLRGLDSSLIILGVIGLLMTASYPLLTWLLGPVHQYVPFAFAPVVTDEQVQRVIYLASFPITLIGLGRLRRPGLRLRSDLSYGLYIYGWPVAQIAIVIAMHFHVRLTPWSLFAVTAIFTVPLAYLSWRLIEHPALRLKRRLWRGAAQDGDQELHAAAP